MRIDVRQLGRLRTTLEVASATGLQSGPAGLLAYSNARNAVRAALEGSDPAREFELLFPRADASFSLSPEYPIVLLGQLLVWLRELEQAERDAVVSPELMLIDPELRAAVLAQAELEPDEPLEPLEPFAAPEPAVAPEAPAPPTPPGSGGDEQQRSIAVAAGAYALRASVRTAAIDVAFLLVVACVVLLISMRA